MGLLDRIVERQQARYVPVDETGVPQPQAMPPMIAALLRNFGLSPEVIEKTKNDIVGQLQAINDNFESLKKNQSLILDNQQTIIMKLSEVENNMVHLMKDKSVDDHLDFLVANSPNGTMGAEVGAIEQLNNDK